MCSQTYPKEFENTSDVLPFTKFGLSSVYEFKEAEKDIYHLERLKKAGLSYEEINLYRENEAGQSQRKNIESNVKKEKLNVIYCKVNKIAKEIQSPEEHEVHASTSKETTKRNIDDILKISYYPEGHPMNQIKDIEQSLFGHLQSNETLPIAKRRKLLRHLERRKERILAQQNKIDISLLANEHKIDRPGSLWDLKESPKKRIVQNSQKTIIGPHKPTMYTIKDHKIVRLEPIHHEQKEEYQAVDIVIPVNNAEVQLLEGTKMSVDDIKKIARFKDYKPGIPSKILYLKNIAPLITQEQLSLLFNQFMLANGGPINVRLMTGRMRGQAFVDFKTEDIAIQALEETNGTIMRGRPIIIQFGRNTNSSQDNR